MKVATVFALNPQYSAFYAIVGEFADWEHRYDEIVELMREAMKLDPDDAVALASLGINLIRAGREADAPALSRAFALDPFNVRVYNTLDLFEKGSRRSTSRPRARSTSGTTRRRARPRALRAALLERPGRRGGALRLHAGDAGASSSTPITSTSHPHERAAEHGIPGRVLRPDPGGDEPAASASTWA